MCSETGQPPVPASCKSKCLNWLAVRRPFITDMRVPSPDVPLVDKVGRLEGSQADRRLFQGAILALMWSNCLSISRGSKSEIGLGTQAM